MDRGTILATKFNQYQIAECLGRGVQGSVYKARRHDGLTVAVKLMRQLTADGLTRFRKEAWTYQQFPDNFVQLLDFNLACQRPFLVLEYCPLGTARDQLRFLCTSHSVTVPLLAQAARSLAALHHQRFLYRDFKPDNLLIAQGPSGAWTAKLGDAGLVCAPPELSLIQTTRFARGDNDYMAPECLRLGALYSKAAESFAFAVAAHEMLCGVRPAAGSQVLVGPADVRNLLTKMIAIDPQVRPSLQEASSRLFAASEFQQRNQVFTLAAIVGVSLVAFWGFGKKR